MSGKITFEAIGPIEKRFEFDVPDCGVVVFEADNGVGKSTGLKVIDAALNGIKPGELGITPTDGNDEGFAEVLGVEFRFSRRCRVGGRVENHIALKGGESFARIVDPGIKDVDRADAQRIKDIAEILSIKPDVRLMRQALGLADDDDRLEEWFGKPTGSVVDWAAAGRRAINTAALEVERLIESTRNQADSHSRQARDLRERGAGYPLDQAQSELEAAIAVEEKAKAAVKARDLVKAISDCRETPVVRAELEKLNAEVKERFEDEISKRNARISELKSEIQKLEAEVVSIKADQTVFVRESVMRVDAELARAIKRDKAVEESAYAVTPEAASTGVSIARGKLAAAMSTKELERLESEVEESRKLIPTLTAEAVTLRAMAKRVDDALTNAVKEKATGLVVIDGGLYVNDHPKREGNVRFEELSKGERVRRVIRLLARNGRIGSAFVIPQESWEGVSPAGRQEVLDECIENRILAFTAKEGPARELKAVVYGE